MNKEFVDKVFKEILTSNRAKCVHRMDTCCAACKYWKTERDYKMVGIGKTNCNIVQSIYDAINFYKVSWNFNVLGMIPIPRYWWRSDIQTALREPGNGTVDEETCYNILSRAFMLLDLKFNILNEEVDRENKT